MKRDHAHVDHTYFGYPLPIDKLYIYIYIYNVCLILNVLLSLCCSVQYKHAVMNSLLEVEDLLSSFDLSPLATHKTIMPKKNTLVHNGAKPVSPNVTSKATKMSTLSDLCLELELQTYESDSLPSSSVGSSEADPGETDERLDFAHNHDPATTHRSKEDKCCISFQEDESEKTKMMKMMIKTQQGLEVCV